MSLWTETEEAEIRKAIYAGKKATEVQLPGRTTAAIAAKMSRMRGNDKTKPWTQEERQILVEYYKEIPMKALLDMLPGRTAGSVRGQVSWLKARGWNIR